MEKRKSTFDLGTIKAEMNDTNSLNMSMTARVCAASLNISLEGIVKIIQGLTRPMFYKSMTANANSKLWQDVYHVPHGKIVLYVKFTMDARGHLLISFKDKDN